jgi:hypothetical protein
MGRGEQTVAAPIKLHSSATLPATVICVAIRESGNRTLGASFLFPSSTPPRPLTTPQSGISLVRVADAKGPQSLTRTPRIGRGEMHVEVEQTEPEAQRRGDDELADGRSKA